MDEEKKEPSGTKAGYDYDDGRLVFYYSRERRLERASPEVRALNEPGPSQKTGLFRTLTSTKPLTFAFLSIITICAAMVLFSFLNNDSRARILDTAIAVSAVKGGDKSYITVKKTITGTAPYTGAVTIAVSVRKDRSAREDSWEENDRPDPMYLETLYFSLEKEETYRFIAPMTGETLLVLAVLDDQTALFRVRPR
ncbi:MAG: hypothetical protein LBP69_05215 [Treponema sp.]|nr:hypothetical protein [Treponema sp.]